MNKPVTFSTACRISKKAKSSGKKVIWTSGFFDIIHIGHIEFFRKVRTWAGKDALIMVGVDTDEFLALTKGVQRPHLFPN